MKILFVTSEAAPFAASGGLGDVLGALPAELVRQGGKNTDIRVILPLYRQVSDKFRREMKTEMVFEFQYAWRRAYCGILSLIHNGVTYYFVDNEQYFRREGGLYGQYDDGERFAYFSMAVIEFILRSDDVPDILHANDWQAALSVVYLRTKYESDPKVQNIRTVYTIHNIEYQGKYDPYILGDVFALDEKYKSILEYSGCLNLMKGAIVCADRVTTVSPNYAKEIQYSYFAYGLEYITNLYSYKISGIINGIDTLYFSPDKGGDITVPYTADTVKDGKAKNKRALQESLGLTVDENIPLVIMITRLTHGKGVDLVLRIFDEMMQSGVQFVLLGTGDNEYERQFSDLCARYPDSARALIRFDRILSKQLYASADIFLMPSKSEPCGLAQMIACAYGTVPIVRSVGGLHDSIVPFGVDGSNGFRFNNFNAHELLFRIKDALSLYRDSHEEWDALVQRAMHSDFTWTTSAKRYLNMYAEMV